MKPGNAIRHFKPTPYVVTRRTGGSYSSAGVQTPGAASSVTIEALVQPLSGRDLLALPEAQGRKEVRLIITESPLYTRSETHEADRLTVDGESWEVINVSAWSFKGDVHYRAHIAVVPT